MDRIQYPKIIKIVFKLNPNISYFAGVGCDADLPCFHSNHQAIQTFPGEQGM